MNSTFDEIDNPECNAEREKILAAGAPDWMPFPASGSPKSVWDAYWENSSAMRAFTTAQQEKQVISQREVIEKFAEMVNEFRLAGEELEKFAQENDIPGICGWDSFTTYIDDDIIGTAIQWAASNHSC